MSSGSSFLTPAGIVSANQADVSAARSRTQFISPGRQFYHPSSAKFWIVFVGTVGPSTNVANYRSPSNVTRTSTGNYLVSVALTFLPFYFVATGISGNDGTGNNFVLRMITINPSSATFVRVHTVNIAGANVNAPRVSVIGHGLE